tara:strand:+ start:10549 stop:13722 length:3174 start_codon:yes stop_codon:yes gene_type:complete
MEEDNSNVFQTINTKRERSGLEEDMDSSRAKSPRNTPDGRAPTPATIQEDNLDLHANLGKLFDYNSKRKIFLEEIFNFCKLWDGVICGSFALATAMDSLNMERRTNYSNLPTWEPGDIDIYFVIKKQRLNEMQINQRNIFTILNSFYTHFCVIRDYLHKIPKKSNFSTKQPLCNGTSIHDSYPNSCMIEAFSSKNYNTVLDVQLIFYYYDETILPYEQIEQSILNVYDYRMLQCYLSVHDLDDIQIKFCSTDAKLDIENKTLIINYNKSEDYNSCMKSIERGIKYMDRGFFPKNITDFWNTQKYRMDGSALRTYNNIKSTGIRYDWKRIESREEIEDICRNNGLIRKNPGDNNLWTRAPHIDYKQPGLLEIDIYEEEFDPNNNRPYIEYSLIERVQRKPFDVQIKWDKLHQMEYWDWWIRPDIIAKMDQETVFFLKTSREKNKFLKTNVNRWIHLSELGSVLNYTLFNPTISDNKVIVTDIDESALCKSNQIIKNVYVRESIEKQKSVIANESRLDKPTFKLIQDDNPTFQNLNLPYTQIFAEQYNQYIYNNDGMTLFDPNGIPTDFLQDYEFTLSQQDRNIAEDVLDYGGIAKLYFTKLNDEFRTISEPSYNLLSADFKKPNPKAAYSYQFEFLPDYMKLVLILKLAEVNNVKQTFKLDNTIFNNVFNTKGIPYIEIISACGMITPPNCSYNSEINIKLLCRFIQETGCKEYEESDKESFDSVFPINQLNFSFPGNRPDMKINVTWGDGTNSVETFPSIYSSTTNLQLEMPRDSIQILEWFRNRVKPGDNAIFPVAVSEFVLSDSDKLNNIPSNVIILLKNHFYSPDQQYTVEDFEDSLQRFVLNSNSTSDGKNIIHQLESWLLFLKLCPCFSIIQLNSEEGKEYIRKLMRYTDSNNPSIDDNTIDRMKEYMNRFFDELSIQDDVHPNIKDFVLFATGTIALPNDFKYTLQIESSDYNTLRLPTSHTCFNQIDLPWIPLYRYPDDFYDKFKEQFVKSLEIIRSVDSNQNNPDSNENNMDIDDHSDEQIPQTPDSPSDNMEGGEKLKQKILRYNHTI